MTAGPVTPEEGSPPTPSEMASQAITPPKVAVPPPRAEPDVLAETPRISDELMRQLNDELGKLQPVVKGTIGNRVRSENDRDDIAQEALWRIFKFRAQGGVYTNDDGGKAFARRLATLEAFEYFRKGKSLRDVPVAELPETEDPLAAELNRRHELIAFLKKHLEPPECEVYVLRYFYDYQVVEIAEMLKVNRRTVSRRLKSAERQVNAVPEEELPRDR